ncbi:MAG: putative rane protein, partial [Jatrophihabitans sp.]|nr:putative rane protein [Jatrophihabitans sp.]
TELGLALPYSMPLLLVAALLLGFVAQGVKISVDTLVQQQVADEFRGRVFSLYDTLFNVTLVVAAVLTATVLPENGYSPTSVVLITLGYAVTAIGYLHLTSRVQPPEPAVVNS